ncbi:MAG: serine hydrolase domain-containing protein, partial [Bacteroidota bacterium]
MTQCSQSTHTVGELFERFENKGHNMKLGAPYNGVALIAVDDSIYLHQAYGYEDWENEVPHTVDNQFPIASITKQFTSMLTMILVDEGMLDLDTPIYTYLPELSNPRLRRVTLHHLLSHTAGLPHYDGLVSLGYSYSTYASSSYTPTELVRMIDQCSLRYEAGEGFYYSSLGYILVGAILESVSEKSYADLLEEKITGPLQMKRTGFGDNEYVKNNVVKGYDYEELYGLDWWKSDLGGEITETKFRDQSGKFSTGGIHSTAMDLWKWSQAIRDRKLISEASYERIFTPTVDGFCYGWIKNWDDLLERNKETSMVMHSGALGGYRSTIAIYDDGTTIISLSNIQPMRDKNLLHQAYLSTHGLKDEYKLEGYPEWPSADEFIDNGGFNTLNTYFDRLSKLAGHEVKPSASSLLRIGIKFLDDDKINQADSIFSHTFQSYEIETGLVNQLGYRLVQMGFCKQSKDFFGYNLAKDSLSANAWDSLGDAFKACGENDKAKFH